MRLSRLGNTSVRCELAVFGSRHEEAAAAQVSAEGHFVHVYVDRATQRRPTPLPDALRQAATALLMSSDA